jgi:putative MATE family efflux protein
MDPGGTVVAAGTAYLRVVLLGAPFLLTAMTCEIAMRAAGDTRTPFLVDLFSISLNVVLAPVFIYGLGPVPKLGVAGAATATVISQVVMLGCYGIVALRRHPSFPLALRAPGAPVGIGALAKVGVPAALIGVLFSVVYVAFVRAVSPLGEAAVAIIGVANRIEAIQFILSVTIGMAGSAMLGQALGAGDPVRAQEVLRTAQRWAIALSSGLTVLLLVVPDRFLALFTRDAALMAIGVPYLRILALTVIATGIEIATAESVMGSGHTREISTIYTAFSVIRIPLAFVVPHWRHAGVFGIAWLITITCTLRAALLVGWAARGTWRRGLTRELQGRAVEPDTIHSGAGAKMD